MKTGSTSTNTGGGELLTTTWWGEPNVRATSVSSWARSPRVCASRVQKSWASERSLVGRRVSPAAEPGDSLLMSAANESSSARIDDAPASSCLSCSAIVVIRSKLRPVGTLSVSNASFSNRRVALCCSADDDSDNFSTVCRRNRANFSWNTLGLLQPVIGWTNTLRFVRFCNSFVRAVYLAFFSIRTTEKVSTAT